MAQNTQQESLREELDKLSITWPAGSYYPDDLIEITEAVLDSVAPWIEQKIKEAVDEALEVLVDDIYKAIEKSRVFTTGDASEEEERRAGIYNEALDRIAFNFSGIEKVLVNLPITKPE